LVDCPATFTPIYFLHEFAVGRMPGGQRSDPYFGRCGGMSDILSNGIIRRKGFRNLCRNV